MLRLSQSLDADGGWLRSPFRMAAITPIAATNCSVTLRVRLIGLLHQLDLFKQVADHRATSHTLQPPSSNMSQYSRRNHVPYYGELFVSSQPTNTSVVVANQ
jgi:hypothetical protein